MIDINLLPLSERRTIWPLTQICSIIVLIVFSVQFLIYLWGLYHVYSLNRQLTELQAQYELLLPTEKSMQSANKKQETINTKNKILSSLTTDRTSWYAIMVHLGATLPQNIWLTEISFAGRNKLHVKGMASTYPGLSDFIQKLQADSFFSDPVLITADSKSGEISNSFELQLKLKGL